MRVVASATTRFPYPHNASRHTRLKVSTQKKGPLLMSEKAGALKIFRSAGPHYRFANNHMSFSQHIKRALVFHLLIAMAISTAHSVIAQSSGGHTLFGDFKVDESGTADIKPISYDIILYTQGGRVVARQAVTDNSRYRFIDVPDGEYNLVVELENSEVARIRVTLASPTRSDFRQDIIMEWRSSSAGAKRKEEKAISVAEGYERAPAHKTLFKRAGEAAQKKDYEQAVALLRQILNGDAKDFEAWTELGTALLSQNKDEDAEKAYLSALEKQPTYILALTNLGRLRLKRKNYGGAVETLSQAVKVQPRSASANFYLGEAYLQIKKGSIAVVYLNEALKLDPIGKAEAHLRLAALYNAAGMKDKAAVEYEQFLKKKPDYPNKEKIQQYISENKKP
jgi:Flp pilus assembly protein TadD